MTDQKITVQITETIKYTNTYTVSELEHVLDTNLAGMTQEEIASRIAHEDKVEEDMQRYGDVLGSKWAVAPGSTVPEQSEPIALAVDDGTSPMVKVLHSMDEVYAVLRENYAQGEDVTDDDLIEHIQSQGTLVYLGS